MDGPHRSGRNVKVELQESMTARKEIYYYIEGRENDLCVLGSGNHG